MSTPDSTKNQAVRFLLFLFMVLGTFVLPARAQPEIVPAEHPIYDFLHLQRVAGHLPEYRHEVRPMDRNRILALLDSLSARNHKLGNAGQYWLKNYREELGEPADQIETYIDEDGLQIPHKRNTVKYLYYRNRGKWRFIAEGGVRLQARYGRDSLVYSGQAIVAQLRLAGNYAETIGFYTDTFNGFQFHGDGRVLKKDPFLRPLYYVSRSPTPVGNFDRTTASFRIANDHVAAELANERLLIGPGFSAPLIMGNAADYFPFLRLSLHTDMLEYQFVHGSLNDRKRVVFSERHPERGVFVGTERYLALHRVALHPFSFLSLGFTEMVVYGQRGVELAYLNPVYPFKTAEHALWDRDNTLFALDGVYRPWPGIETFGTILVDDLNFSKIGEHSYSVKVGYQAGVGFTPLSNLLGWVTYTRIYPFVYTHRFELRGSFYNSYQHNGFTLGHPLGPNTDRIEIGLRYWFPFRLRASLRLQYTRRGENFIGADGELINVGGDPVNGIHPSYSEESKRFLAGGLFYGPGAVFNITWEPVRDLIKLRVAGYWQQWTYGGITPLRGYAPPPDDNLDRVRGSAADDVFVRVGLTVGL